MAYSFLDRWWPDKRQMGPAWQVPAWESVLHFAYGCLAAAFAQVFIRYK
jgi:hypothetical protein